MSPGGLQLANRGAAKSVVGDVFRQIGHQSDQIGLDRPATFGDVQLSSEVLSITDPATKNDGLIGPSLRIGRGDRVGHYPVPDAPRSCVLMAGWKGCPIRRAAALAARSRRQLLGEILLAARQDLISREATRRTQLTTADFELFGVAKR